MVANEKRAATYHGGAYVPDAIERRVRSEICRVVVNASNWPTPVGTQMLGRDLAEPIDKITEALIPLIREAKAEALERLASEVHSKFQAAWIRGKAREYTHGPHKPVGAFSTPENKEKTP